MSHIKLVVTDVDGTLVELLADVVSDKVRQAVIDAENRGISVVPVTGRPLEMAQSVFNVLGFDELCVVDNGASIRKVQTGELVWSQWLEAKVLKQVVKTVLPYSTRIDYSPNYHEHEPEPDEYKTIQDAAPYVFSLFEIVDEPKVIKLLQAIPGIIFYVGPYPEFPDQHSVLITHHLATKFHGVEALRHITGNSKAHTMAIGDGNNDVPLFENANLKIAMGNATESLKEQADHIVSTVQEDGFAEAMERFVLV